MIIKNDKNYGIPISDRLFFKENFNKISPLKKITVFFDDENFLLTKYKTDAGTTFVAESWNDNEIHLTGLNCGYGGHGPSETARVLEFVGVNEKKANDIKWEPGLQIDFDENGVPVKYNKEAFFSSQGEHIHSCKVHLDRFTYIEFETKKIYFVNPLSHCIKDVFTAIDTFKPYEFQYYIGEDSPLDNGYFPPDKFDLHNIRYKEGITGVNLILRSNNLDILILIDKSIARSFIDSIHYYIFKKKLFSSNIISIDSLPKWKTYFISLIARSHKQPIHGVIKID